MKIRKSSKVPGKKQQNGFLLLALLLVFMLAATSIALGTIGTRQTVQLDQQKDLHRNMELAKAALLAYAANNANLHNNEQGPGFFPCPDTTNVSHQPTSTCDSDEPLVGRLPQYVNINGQKFNFNDAYAGIDEQFWYVVAPRYVYYSTDNIKRRSYFRTYADSSNSIATDYWLSLDGEKKYVALIIAPGAAINGQDRINGSTNYTNYLDGENGSNGFNYYSKNTSNPTAFNDQILGISIDDYIVPVGTAVASQMKPLIELYHHTNGTFPPTSGSSTADPSTACASTFSEIFSSSPVWLRDVASTGNNRERWSCTHGAYWKLDTTSPWSTTLPNPNKGYLLFNGCLNLIFTFEYTTEPSNYSFKRSGKGC